VAAIKDNSTLRNMLDFMLVSAVSMGVLAEEAQTGLVDALLHASCEEFEARREAQLAVERLYKRANEAP
jgi:hypothetical protein